MTLERPKVIRTCGVLAFRLRNVLLARMACTFWTALLPKVVRHCGVLLRAWYVLHILTSKCSSRQNGLHFFDICTSKKWSGHGVFFSHFDFEPRFGPNGVQFSPLISPYGCTPAVLASLLFDPPELQTIRKTVFHDLSTFLRTLIIFLLPFSSLTLPTSAFPSVHFVGSLTSKLPSVMWFAHAQAWTDALLPVAKSLCCDTCLSAFWITVIAFQNPHLSPPEVQRTTSAPSGRLRSNLDARWHQRIWGFPTSQGHSGKWFHVVLQLNNVVWRVLLSERVKVLHTEFWITILDY